MGKRINAFVDLANAGGICGWLLLMQPLLSFVFSRRRDPNAYAAVDASAMVFILYAVVCFLFSMRELNTQSSILGRKLLFKSPLALFLVYSLYGLVSLFWSVNLSLSGYRAFECIAMMTMMIAIVQKLFERGNTSIVIDWVILYVVVDIVFSVTRALAYTTNIFELLQRSQMMATVFFFMALYYKPKRWWHYLIMAMSIFSMSTVSYIGMALGCVSTFYSQQKYRTIAFLGALILGTVIVAVGPYRFVKDTVFFDKKEISIHETSGRDHIMEVSMKALVDRPEGYGFVAGERFLLNRRGMGGVINGHNSLFSAAIGLGIPGIVLISLFFLMMARTAFSRHIPPEYRATIIGCFIVGFLQCMGNPGLGSRVYGGWMPVMFLCVTICGFYVNSKYFEPYEDAEQTEDEE